MRHPRKHATPVNIVNVHHAYAFIYAIMIMITIMRLFIYKALTQIIIILGVIREKLDLQRVIRRERTFKDPSDHFFSIECCDCGLTHFRKVKEGLEQPIRPEDYDYTWRHYAGDPSEIRHDSEW